MLKFYNTLTNQLEEFKPITDGHVLMYNCGPTVYNFAHIGNLSSYLMADLIRRYLEYKGLKVKQVMNITDVGHLVSDSDTGEDKMEKTAREEKLDPFQVARKFEDAFHIDRKKLNILDAHEYPRATEWVSQQLVVVKTLIEKGYAYHTSDGIYFDVQKFKEYGKLSGNKLTDLDAGSRVEVNEEKHHPYDFALWKKCVGENADHIMRWDFNTGKKVKLAHSDNKINQPNYSPLSRGDVPFSGTEGSEGGREDENNESRLRDTASPRSSLSALNSPGFPGWHIECSTMSSGLLADQIDIHTGGEDNIFPHHECEIAQAESISGKQFCNYWVHKRHIFVDGEKMSKSKGNFFTMADLEGKGYSALTYRYLILSSHYRQNTNFTFKGLDDAQKSIDRLQSFLEAVQEASDKGPSIEVSKARESLEAALDEDLNTSGALAAVFDLVRQGNIALEEGGIKNRLDVLNFLRNFDSVFAILSWDVKEDLNAEVQLLINQREEARSAGDYETSDRIRDELAVKGIELLDVKGETKWRDKGFKANQSPVENDECT